MYVLISMFILAVVYVCSFKDDFTAEKLERLAPLFIIGGILIVLFGVIASMLG